MRHTLVAACLLSASSQLFGQTAGACSIQGQVLNALTGDPVEGAVVSLRVVQEASGALQPVLAVQPKSETDARGHFAFRDLQPWDYELQVQRQGFSGALPGQRTPIRVALGEDQHLTDFLIRLVPVAAISGIVVDSSGAPVAGIRVSASRQTSRGTAQILSTSASAQTGGAGEYRLANLPAGTYFVAVQPSGSLPVPDGASPDTPQTAVVTTFYPGVTDPLAAGSVAAAPGADVRGIVIKLPTVETVSIRGKIAGAAAMSDLPIYAGVRERVGGMEPRSGAATISADGSFLIRGVPAGSYDLIAWQGAPSKPNSPATLAIQPIEVGGKSVDGLTLQLLPIADVHGVIESDPPGACDPRSAIVRAMPTGGNFLGSMHEAMSDQDHKFVLRGVPPATYSLAAGLGRSACYVKSIRSGGQEYPVSGVPLRGDSPLEIVAAPSGASLAVAAVDRQGNAFPRAEVAYLGKVANRVVISTAGFDGRAASGVLPPGSYTVFAFEELKIELQFPEYLQRFADRAKTVALTPNAHAEVEVAVVPLSETVDRALASLPRAPSRARGSVAGQVLDANSGAPLPDAAISLQACSGGAPGAAPVRTDSQGRFTVANLEPGCYALSVQKPGYRYTPSRQSLGTNNPWLIIVGEGQSVEALLNMAP